VETSPDGAVVMNVALDENVDVPPRNFNVAITPRHTQYRFSRFLSIFSYTSALPVKVLSFTKHY
jgi:hypothetical protein